MYGCIFTSTAIRPVAIAAGGGLIVRSILETGVKLFVLPLLFNSLIGGAYGVESGERLVETLLGALGYVKHVELMEG
jgi:hypothetical protein